MSVEDKKERKKAQLKKNRKQNEIFQAFRMMRGDSERAIQDNAERMESKPAPASQEAWGDKVNIIRNRLTGSKRASRERWNRFAGTGGEGGRGL